ncbi:MAG: hypothetical protein ACRETO_02635 [Gammaproteobacteria bacterium]
MKLPALLSVCLLLIPAIAWAGNFNYDYAELDYQHTDPQVGEATKGPALQFSYTILDKDVQLLVGYARLDTPATPADINNHNYWIGLRGENAFGDSTDFYTDILYLNDRATSQAPASTANGYRLLLGMRHEFTSRLEFNGSLAHDYLDQSNNEVAIGLVFNVTHYLAAGLSYAHDSLRNNTVTLRVRAYY